MLAGLLDGFKRSFAFQLMRPVKTYHLLREYCYQLAGYSPCENFQSSRKERVLKHQAEEGNPVLKPRETAEEQRLAELRERKAHWKRWGPYLSERAWGTVREDYSAYGTAWDYLPHDRARSKAYR